MLIVKKAIASASTANTVLVGDDTDLLILLCYHAPLDSSHEIYFKPEAKAGINKLPQCWNIKNTKKNL